MVSLRPLDFWRGRILGLIGGNRAQSESELMHETVRLQELLADIVQAEEKDMGNDITRLEGAKLAIAETMDVRAAAARLDQSYEGFR
ncbi:MAG: hypothetical protein AAF941_04035 [Pseudomonadota bacterium]